MRQYVIESMCRSIGNLLLIVPYPYKQHEAAQSKNSTVQDIIIAFENRPNLVDVISYRRNYIDRRNSLTNGDPANIEITTQHFKYKEYLKRELQSLENREEHDEVKKPLR